MANSSFAEQLSFNGNKQDAVISSLPAQNIDESPKKSLASLFGQDKAKPKFLPVSQAFGVMATQKGDTITVKFKVTPKHYIYRDKLKLILPDELKSAVKMGNWQFSQVATTVDDPEFGKVAVFEKDVVATITIANQGNSYAGDVSIGWQGCATAGLCYPPERTKLSITLPAAQAADTKKQPIKETKTPKKNSDTATKDNADQQSQIPPQNDKTAMVENQPSLLDNAVNQDDGQAVSNQYNNTPQSADNQKFSDNQEQNHNLAINAAIQDSPVAMTFGLENNPILAIGLLFLAGIGLAFTACVYPMIPIVANIVAKSHNPSAKRGFILTLAYGLGVATSYGILGAVIAWAGKSLGILGWLQNPVIVLGFAAIFVLLGLYMLEVFRISLPSGLRHKLGKVSSVFDHRLGSVGGSFLVGMVSSLVVSPCVSAPLAGALLSVSAIGNVVLGFFALFALGFGLSLPLIIIGVLEGKFMPKAGAWMQNVKVFAGLMLFLVAIFLVGRVFVEPFMLLVLAGWFAIMAVFFWQFHKIALRAIGLMAALWTGCLLVGFGLGETDILQPLRKIGISQTQLVQTTKNQKITTLTELDELVVNHQKVLVEITADWCIECRIMEKTLFTNRPQALNEWQVVKLDITKTTNESRAVLDRYQLFGPPALLYYYNGKLVQTELGEVKRNEFEQTLKRLNAL